MTGKLRQAPAQAIGLILAMTLIPSATALAYFTSNASAEGGFELSLHPSTEITETFANKTKHVVITNNRESVPLYVRAKALSSLPLSYDGDGWGQPMSDGWLYYAEAINPGDETNPLDVSISFPDRGLQDATEGGGAPLGLSNPRTGEEHDVIVVYEATPVLYDGSGSPLGMTECWNRATGEDGDQ